MVIGVQKVYSVTQINAYIKNMFASDPVFDFIFIEGEVSNCKYHTSGHIYFTIKDIKGTLSCVMFAGNRGGLDFRLQEGQKVIVGGNIATYERDGKYQLYAKKIILGGAGLLYEKFERLKVELEERGMFSSTYKQPIPHFVKTLGVVTAKTGAAVQDIINVAKRRNPYIQIILFPAIVQGEYAVNSIVTGIQMLEQQQVDVIIVGRGGGSIEDLWAFNEEKVAQAIFDCSVPIISAVGHETDTTIADFVADMRAPTPSAAAELAVINLIEMEEKIENYYIQLKRSVQRKLRFMRSNLEYLSGQMKRLSPMAQIKEKRFFLLKLEEQMQNNMSRIVERKKHRLSIYIERMKGLSPLDKLNQGMAFVSDKNGKCINQIGQVEVGDTVQIHLKDGVIHGVAKNLEKINR